MSEQSKSRSSRRRRNRKRAAEPPKQEPETKPAPKKVPRQPLEDPVYQLLVGFDPTQLDREQLIAMVQVLQKKLRQTTEEYDNRLKKNRAATEIIMQRYRELYAQIP